MRSAGSSAPREPSVSDPHLRGRSASSSSVLAEAAADEDTLDGNPLYQVPPSALSSFSQGPLMAPSAPPSVVVPAPVAASAATTADPVLQALPHPPSSVATLTMAAAACAKPAAPRALQKQHRGRHQLQSILGGAFCASPPRQRAAAHACSQRKVSAAAAISPSGLALPQDRKSFIFATIDDRCARVPARLRRPRYLPAAVASAEC